MRCHTLGECDGLVCPTAAGVCGELVVSALRAAFAPWRGSWLSFRARLMTCGLPRCARMGVVPDEGLCCGCSLSYAPDRVRHVRRGARGRDVQGMVGGWGTRGVSVWCRAVAGLCGFLCVQAVFPGYLRHAVRASPCVYATLLHLAIKPVSDWCARGASSLVCRPAVGDLPCYFRRREGVGGRTTCVRAVACTPGAGRWQALVMRGRAINPCMRTQRRPAIPCHSPCPATVMLGP